MNILGIVIGAAIVFVCLIALKKVAEDPDGGPMTCDHNCAGCNLECHDKE